MPTHFHRDLEAIRKSLLGVGGLVEAQVERAITALTERRKDLIEAVLEGDAPIDEAEVQVEEETLKTLALHQPVANDLRFLIAVLKMNRDLERMGDLAVQMAECAAFVLRWPALPVVLDFTGLGRSVRQQVRAGLDALVRVDTVLARDVLERDDLVEAQVHTISERLEELMQQDASALRRGIRLMQAARHLERISDLATNVAEDVIFMVEGEVVRHRHAELEPGGRDLV